MRAIVQRVNDAKIIINSSAEREIKKGFVVYLGVMQGDTVVDADYLVNKISDLRIFTDENDKMNLSIKDINGDILVVSNFTLSADCRKGRRPSFERAAKPAEAVELYNYFLKGLRKAEGLGTIESGEFGAHMNIICDSDGPVNLIMDTKVISK